MLRFVRAGRREVVLHWVRSGRGFARGKVRVNSRTREGWRGEGGVVVGSVAVVSSRNREGIERVRERPSSSCRLRVMEAEIGFHSEAARGPFREKRRAMSWCFGLDAVGFARDFLCLVGFGEEALDDSSWPEKENVS